MIWPNRGQNWLSITDGRYSNDPDSLEAEIEIPEPNISASNPNWRQFDEHEMICGSLTNMVCTLSVFVSGVVVHCAIPNGGDTGEQDCNEICRYAPQVQKAACKNLKLVRIPKRAGMCSDATTFEISYNKIAVISPDDFAEYLSIKVLLLGHNQLSDIPVNMCGNSTEIIQLQMNDNTLWRVPTDAFQNLDNLRQLYLDRNIIRELQTGAFDGLRSLTALFLPHNNISRVPSGIFRDLTSLIKLNLAYNVIGQLTPQTFTGLSQLQRVDLSNNRITSISTEFTHAINLLWISLANNNITSLAKMQFSPQLQVLNMDDNNITTIDNIEDFLTAANSLQALSLANNPLSCDCAMEPLRVWYRLNSPTENAICATSAADVDGLRLAAHTEPLCILEITTRTMDGLHSNLTIPRTILMGPDGGSMNVRIAQAAAICVPMIMLVMVAVVIVYVSYKHFKQKGKRKGNHVIHSRPSPMSRRNQQRESLTPLTLPRSLTTPTNQDTGDSSADEDGYVVCNPTINSQNTSCGIAPPQHVPCVPHRSTSLRSGRPDRDIHDGPSTCPLVEPLPVVDENPRSTSLGSDVPTLIFDENQNCTMYPPSVSTDDDDPFPSSDTPTLHYPSLDSRTPSTSYVPHTTDTSYSGYELVGF